MTRLELRVDPRIFETFPDVRIGALAVYGVDNSRENPEIRRLLDAAQRRAVERLDGVPVVEHPHIAPWREAYRRFGAKPKKYRSSIENLLRRVLSDATLPSINPLVDLYNTISLRHLVPVGGESLEQIEGTIELTFAAETEAPVLLLGEREPRAPHVGEVIYKDAAGTICRRWNWKEADRTKLTADTRHAVLVIEALPPVDQGMLEAALTELAAAIERFCGGRYALGYLHRGNSAVILPA